MNKGYGILIVSVTILVLCFAGTASATNWSVDSSGGADFTGIQDAINNAKDGDTIIVHSGVYYENVVVDKSVTIRGIGHPVVDARRCGKSVVTLSADGITVEGFNVTKGSWEGAGITISSSNNTITGNTVYHSNKCGIDLLSSSNNTITDNNISNNGCGIFLWHSSNNNITGNNISNNRHYGIGLGSSSNNTITGNAFVNDGLLVIEAYQNTVEDNIVNGKPLVYLEDLSDYKVEDAGQVILVNCSKITVEKLDISNTCVGIDIWGTEDSIISNNTVSNNNIGILLGSSSNNNITGNNLSNNSYHGIRLYDSSNNNNITGNNVSNNNGDGISLDKSSNNFITGNNVSNNNVEGISLDESSNNNTITGNNVSNNNGGGIYLPYSHNNTITGNTVSSNNDDGIYLYYSSNNNITGNNISNHINGIALYYSSNNNTITNNTFVNDGLIVFVSRQYVKQNRVEDNTVNGKPLVYLIDASNYKIKDAGQVILSNCNNITVENLDLSNISVGIELWETVESTISNNKLCNNSVCGIRLSSSGNNTITGNNVCNNWNGIVLRDSSNNTIIGNNASNNYWSGIHLSFSSNNKITGNNVSNNEKGIHLDDSSNNKIYLNNFINNTDNVDSYEPTNIWNSPLEITYTYDGTTYKSYLGNYWDDYEGTDAEGDGIGNTPYRIDSKNDESDDYPLMKLFENYYHGFSQS